MSSSQQRQRPEQINVGLAKSEAAAINQAARQSGLSRAAFLRHLALNAIDVSAVTNSRRHRPLSSADLEAVAILLSELGRTTGSVVQLAKALRQSGREPHHEAIERVISDLRSQAEATAGLVERLSVER